MKYSEIKTGQTAELSHTITQKDVYDFIVITGDDNPVHTKGDCIVHGMLTASFISTLIGTKLPGNGSVWTSQSLNFVRPVKIGDTITVKGEVHGKRDKNKTITLLTDVSNQNDEVVIFGIASVIVNDNG